MMNLKKKVVTLTSTVAFFITATLPSHAAIVNPVTGDLGNDATKAASGVTFVDYFTTIWNSFTILGAIAVLIMFLWGALEWITAGGDSSKIEKARNRITQSMLGLLVLVSAFVIIGFVSQLFFGEEFSILNLTFTKVGGEE